MVRKNKEYARIRQSNYQKTDKGKLIQKNAKFRYKGNRADKLDSTMINAILIKQGGACRFCDSVLQENKGRHLDHIVPLTCGGKSEESNLQWLCARCNCSKNSRSNEEYFISIRDRIIYSINHFIIPKILMPWLHR